jgi:DnaB-like helicase N terminal domain
MADIAAHEREFLGAAMSGYQAWAPDVSVEDFTVPAHRMIWAAIAKIKADGGFIHPNAVADRLSHQQLDELGGVQFLIRLSALERQPLLDQQHPRELVTAIVRDWTEARLTEGGDWWSWYSEYLNSDAWKAKRRKVLDRCGGLCEGCREDRVTEIHHLTYAHVGDELLFELVGLCDACHERAHRSNSPAWRRGFDAASVSRTSSGAGSRQ